MPTLSVRFITTGYRAVLDDMYPHLSLKERNCLHVIYERLRLADEQMDTFEKNFISAMKDKIISDPVTVYVGRLQEFLDSLTVVEALARDYINNKPVDVFGTTSNRGQP